MKEYFEGLDLNLGKQVDSFIRWLTVNYSGLFDAIRDIGLWFLLKIESFLLWLPLWVWLLLIFVLSWRLLSLKKAVLHMGMMLLIVSFGLWEETIMTFAIIFSSVVISLLLGIPLGVLVSRFDRLDKLLQPLFDAMQTMPSFVYLIPAIMLFGMGKVPAVFATTIYGIVPVVRLTNLGLRQVGREYIEVADSFGCTYWQKLFKVLIPQALPSIKMGINQTTMMSLGMVVAASMIGAKGLGLEVLTAINRIDIAKGFEAGLSVVFLAIIADRLIQASTKRKTLSSFNNLDINFKEKQ
ncbi:MAG: ABC transporter permease subunit [Mollicutes bacterium]|nr:ABC transporter permease subunit [Mollicutes bacterium]